MAESPPMLDASSTWIGVATLVVAGLGTIGILLAGGTGELVFGWLAACGLGAGQALNSVKTHLVQRAVGPANGENLRDLLAQIAAMDTYAHDSTHKLINAVTPLAQAMPTVLARLDRIEQALPPKAGQ